jgi:uncharacterized 2Fe-2S/4Fe-4S cluster protein (DUF4445 family)
LSFTIEFQPLGIDLVCSEPLTLLDAARQSGINLRSECGGKGTCGKCAVEILTLQDLTPPTESETTLFTPDQLLKGMRLACEFMADRDLKVKIPTSSTVERQVLQVKGNQKEIQPDPMVIQKLVRINEATLNSLESEFTRLCKISGIVNLKTSLDVLRHIPDLLKKNDQRVNLVISENELINLTSEEIHPLLGLAVDVGSTKLACYLMDLKTGKVLAAKGIPNPQIAYGDDIMTRLAYAIKNPSQSELMHSLLIQSINLAASELCSQINASPSNIVDSCFVGNTVMHHFLLDLPVETLAFSPFVPIISDALSPRSSEIGFLAMPGSKVLLPSIIAGFVGSDHLAFLLSEGFGDDSHVRLGIDIGTNTEIALRKNGRIVSVSTASGPAFEGAHIRFGMRAGLGAIEHITLNHQGKADIHTIGNVNPIGICGSGILDAVSELRRVGILNSRGRLDKSAPGVRVDDLGKPYFIIAESERQITLSQMDIDQILLAKGAIRAGIDVLMNYLKVKPGDIEEILIAGAFGSYMDPKQAIRLGMLPAISSSCIRAVGNAAGAGARMMLVSKAERQKAEELANRIEYLELTLYPEFPIFFAHGIQA